MPELAVILAVLWEVIGIFLQNNGSTYMCTCVFQFLVYVKCNTPISVANCQCIINIKSINFSHYYYYFCSSRLTYSVAMRIK